MPGALAVCLPRPHGAGKSGYTQDRCRRRATGGRIIISFGSTLDQALGLKAGFDRDALIDAIEDHVIEQARVVGVYSR